MPSANFDLTKFSDHLLTTLLESSDVTKEEMKAFKKAMQEQSFMMSVFAETLINHPNYMDGFLMKRTNSLEEFTSFFLQYGLK